MTATAELTALARRLERVENGLADAQARLPGLRQDVALVREQLAELGRTSTRAAAGPGAL